jgi:hypothetical protein
MASCACLALKSSLKKLAKKQFKIMVFAFDFSAMPCQEGFRLEDHD